MPTNSDRRSYQGVTALRNDAEVLQVRGHTLAWLATQRSSSVELDGLLAFRDEAREGARPAIQRLHALGIRTVMISGDNEGAAWSIAAELGIAEVHPNVRPEQKVDVIRALKSQGTVAMVGDGINDAPACPCAASDPRFHLPRR